MVKTTRYCWPGPRAISNRACSITSGSISCRARRWRFRIGSEISRGALRKGRSAQGSSSHCLPERSLPAKNARKPGSLHSWRFAPDASPCLSLVSLSDRTVSTADELFGMFESPRKARNALHRMAATHRLCHSLLGIGEASGAACAGCAVDSGAPACDRGTASSCPPYAGVRRVARASRSGLALCGSDRDSRAPRPLHRRSLALSGDSEEHCRNSRRTRNASCRLRCEDVPASRESAAQGPAEQDRLAGSRRRTAALAIGRKGCSPPVPCCPHPEPEFKRVACRGLQALPLGSAHQPANGAATSLGSIGSKSVRTTRTPQGTW